MKKILITGISGFAGSFLAEYLLNLSDAKIFGIFVNEKELKNIQHIKNKIKLFKVDITSLNQIQNIILKIKPDQIFHLAALASAQEQDRKKVFGVNVQGTLNLLESCKVLSKVKILLVSTGYVYGSNRKDGQGRIIPFTEKNPPRPLGIYAESKYEMEQKARNFLKYKNLEIIIARAFSHTGPRQTPQFVIPAFCQQIAQIESGIKKEILIGNIDVIRDFSDVRDVVLAYHLLINKGKSGEIYNIASGKGYKIKDVLHQLLTLSQKKITIKRDPKRLRKVEIEISVGSFKKLNFLTGWQPKINLNKTLVDTLNYWRSKF